MDDYVVVVLQYGAKPNVGRLQCKSSCRGCVISSPCSLFDTSSAPSWPDPYHLRYLTHYYSYSSHGSVSLLPYLQILATGPRVPAPCSALFIIWLYLIVTLLLTTYHHSLFALACVLFSCPLLLPHRRHGLSSMVPSPVYN